MKHTSPCGDEHNFVDNWTTEIKKTLEKFESLEDAQDALLVKYANLPSEQLSQIMGLAYELAMLQGMQAVRDEAEK